MITIKQFSVSTDMKTISVDIEVDAGQLVTKLSFWNQTNYKNPSDFVNLDTKITSGNNTETFEITTEEAGLTLFNGLYFLEIESDDVSDIPGIVATMSLTRYYSVIAGLLCNIDLSCLNCNDEFQNALLLDMYVEAMQKAIVLGRFQDAIGFLEKINIFALYECDTCENLNPEVSTPGNIISIGVLDCILNL